MGFEPFNGLFTKPTYTISALLFKNPLLGLEKIKSKLEFILMAEFFTAPTCTTTTIITLEPYKHTWPMGMAMHLCCAQDGNDRSEEDGNNMIALRDIIVPTSIRWWSQFFF
jgi:hypothetical protein